MFRGKGWFSGGISKPKNPHSLEHLKYLYHVLYKNQNVHDQNKGLLVETLRSIAEILIWGDQNDSTVFDFFLEKNMLSFFLKIMRQKCGSYVCVQLLQTLNILFENIRNETSLYYLLSNNHVNSIIVHKFDFSDEEVMAYYISFLKTLSLKLNAHTIHFFYNEHTNDFPLYTEAIKFFNHNESMVRIAVRTLTLNVFKVEDRAMLKFIRDRTAAPYFSNLVWFIGNHVLELDTCVKNSDVQIHPKLSDLVAEHLDHLHYLNDILCLQITALNDVLTDHLLNRLLIPLYVYSLVQRKHLNHDQDEKPHVSSIVSLFLLSQVFLIISYQPLVQQLAHIILNGELSLFCGGSSTTLSGHNETGSEPEFVAPEVTLEKSLENAIPSRVSLDRLSNEDDTEAKEQAATANDNEVFFRHKKIRSGDTLPEEDENVVEPETSEALQNNNPEITEAVGPSHVDPHVLEAANITDEEKAVACQKLSIFEIIQENFAIADRPFLAAAFAALDCAESDHAALFALCLLYAVGHNPAGINQDLLDTVLMPSDKSETKFYYNVNLIEKMLKIIGLSCQYNSKVRLATLQMTILLLKQLAVKNTQSYLQDRHLAAIEQYREESSLMLRNFYRSEEIFLDMFEDEYDELKKKPLNVEYLMMDAKLLLPPTGTPMSGVEFHKRLPCGEVERARRAIRVFFLLRDLSLTLQNEEETQLPLTTSHVKVNDLLDLNNGDLFYCTVVTRDGHKMKRFMVVDAFQLVLVESEPKRPGWGVAKFVGNLQDIEVTGDKDDSQCLHITVLRPSGKAASSSRSPLLAAKFIFDDNIRCLAAKQSITRGRRKARQRKLHQIARLLDLPDHVQPCPSPLRRGLHAVRDSDSQSAMHRSQSQDTGLKGQSGLGHVRPGHRARHGVFSPSGKVPGYATKLRQEEIKHSTPEASSKVHRKGERRRMSSPVSSRRSSSSKSREPSPCPQGSNPEEIPLEDLSKSCNSRHTSPSIRRKSTSGLPQARISAPPGICCVHHLSSGQARNSPAVTSFDKTAGQCDGLPSPNDEIFPPIAPAAQQPATSSAAVPISLVSNENGNAFAKSPVIIVPADGPHSGASGCTAGSNSVVPCSKPCCAADSQHEKQPDMEACVTDDGNSSVKHVNACDSLSAGTADTPEAKTQGNEQSVEQMKDKSVSSGKVKGSIQTV